MQDSTPNVAKVKQFYVFPNGTRKNLEDMSADELREAHEELGRKIAKEERKIVVLSRVGDEVASMLQFKTSDLFATVPPNSPYADLAVVYNEETDARAE